MRLWRVLGGLVALVILAAGTALLIPLDSLRTPLEEAASRALGRQVQIEGHLRLAVFPEFGISLKDVSIANASGAHTPQMISVGKVVVGAELSSLFSGHLRVTKIVLKEPAIHLETDAKGAGNWQFGQAGAAGSASDAISLRVDRVRIENGEISYLDARTGKSETLSGVSVTLSEAATNGAARPVAVDGSAVYRAVPVKFSATLNDAEGFLQGKPSDAAVKISSDKFAAAYTGKLRPTGEATGGLTFSTPSVRSLAAWAGQPMPPGSGFGALNLQAMATAATNGVYALSNAKITLDNMTLSGDVSVDTLHRAIKAELNEVAAFGGKGKATVALDASGAVPTVHETLQMSGVQTGPFLQQMFGVAKLQATGSVHLDVTARGLNEGDILRSLTGQGSINLANGAISGVDMGAVAKLLQSTARVLGGAVGDSSRTDFTALSAAFTIRNGVAQTSDLQMTSPTVNMTGAGSVDLASRQVDFHIVPKAQLGVAGVNLVDFGVPFYVKGTIDNPSFEPDPAGIAKGLVGTVGSTATGVVGTATGVVGTVGGTATKVLEVPGNAIKSLFGN